jgi:benzoyl-CoA reductase subunit D
MITTAGIDIGTGAVKIVLFKTDGDKTEWLNKRTERIRQRDPFQLTKSAYDEVLKESGLTRDDVHYLATTGEGESITYSTDIFTP